MKTFQYYMLVLAAIAALLISIYIYHHGNRIHRVFSMPELTGALLLIEAYYSNVKGEIFKFKASIGGYRYAGRISRADNPKRVARYIGIETFVGTLLFVVGIGLHLVLR